MLELAIWKSKIDERTGWIVDMKMECPIDSLWMVVIIVPYVLSFVVMSTVVADAPPPPTTMPTATLTTLFVELNLIYYFYLFISITIIYLFTTTCRAVHRRHASRCRHRR